MIPSSRSGKGLQSKQEGDANDIKFSSKASSSSSRQWSDFRNPRIVRVSHSFGGKDRHSKVCTIRGLRDRRIRLSVPTAIQLYDLQDRLGLNQPSKVIDWLLDATKMDIDKLPPLQIPPDFGQFFHAPNASHQSSFPNTFFDPNSTFLKDGGGAHNSRNNVEGEEITVAEKDEQENQDHGNGGNGQILAQNLFPIPSLMMNNAMPYNYYHWEPSNPSLFPFGSHGFLTQTDHQTPLNNSAAAAAAAAPSGSQLFFCPPAASTPSLFPPPYPTPLESDQLRQINQFQFLSSSSSSQHVLPNSLTSSLSGKVPFSLDVNSKLLPSKK